MDGQRNLERTWKIREFEQTDEKIYLFCSGGEKMYFLMKQSKPIFPLIGATFKGEN